jgi:site-specific recombinase XerC
MADLWMYVAVERQTRILNDSATELFLTKEGRRYKTRSVWKLYSENMGAGLHVYPHLLRHTYATHTLAAVSKIMNVGNALLYVRDRLGHSSIKTTEVYLHYKDDIAVAVSEQYQAELSRLA